jgi:DNA polymerase elongation subunit (family B)
MSFLKQFPLHYSFTDEIIQILKRYKPLKWKDIENQKTLLCNVFLLENITLRSNSPNKKPYEAVGIYACLNNEQRIYIQVPDFQPYFYISIPEKWSKIDCDLFLNKLCEMCNVDREVLYKYEITKCIDLRVHRDIQTVMRIYSTKFNVSRKIANELFDSSFNDLLVQTFDLVDVKSNTDPEDYTLFKAYEIHDIHLRFMTDNKISCGMWIELDVSQIEEVSLEERLQYNHGLLEIKTNSDNIKPLPDKLDMIKHRFLFYDWEQYSSSGGFPDSKKLQDKFYLVGNEFYLEETGESWVITILESTLIPTHINYEMKYIHFSARNYKEIQYIYASLYQVIDPDIAEAFNNTLYDDPETFQYAKTVGLIEEIKNESGYTSIQPVKHEMFNIEYNETLMRHYNWLEEDSQAFDNTMEILKSSARNKVTSFTRKRGADEANGFYSLFDEQMEDDENPNIHESQLEFTGTKKNSYCYKERPVPAYGWFSRRAFHFCDVKKNIIQSKQTGARETYTWMVPGRAIIDTRVEVKGSEKFREYSLNFICQKILNMTKVDLPPKLQFQMFREGSDPNDPLAVQKLERLLTYVRKDAHLVRGIETKRLIKNKLMQTSGATFINFDKLLTAGQQIRVHQNLLSECRRNVDVKKSPDSIIYIIPYNKSVNDSYIPQWKVESVKYVEEVLKGENSKFLNCEGEDEDDEESEDEEEEEEEEDDENHNDEVSLGKKPTQKNLKSRYDIQIADSVTQMDKILSKEQTSKQMVCYYYRDEDQYCWDPQHDKLINMNYSKMKDPVQRLIVDASHRKDQLNKYQNFSKDILIFSVGKERFIDAQKKTAFSVMHKQINPILAEARFKAEGITLEPSNDKKRMKEYSSADVVDQYKPLSLLKKENLSSDEKKEKRKYHLQIRKKLKEVKYEGATVLDPKRGVYNTTEREVLRPQKPDGTYDIKNSLIYLSTSELNELIHKVTQESFFDQLAKCFEKDNPSKIEVTAQPIFTLDFSSLYPSIMDANNSCISSKLSQRQIVKFGYELNKDYTKVIKSSVKEYYLKPMCECCTKKFDEQIRPNPKIERFDPNSMTENNGNYHTFTPCENEVKIEEDFVKKHNLREDVHYNIVIDKHIYVNYLKKMCKECFSCMECIGMERGKFCEKHQYCPTGNCPKFRHRALIPEVIQKCLKMRSINKKEMGKYDDKVSETIKELLTFLKMDLSTPEHQISLPPPPSEITSQEVDIRERLIGYKLLAALFNGRQLAFKVLCNSIYGYMGAQNGFCSDRDIAESVTGDGRDMIFKMKSNVGLTPIKWPEFEKSIQKSEAFPEDPDKLKRKMKGHVLFKETSDSKEMTLIARYPEIKYEHKVQIPNDDVIQSYMKSEVIYGDTDSIMPKLHIPQSIMMYPTYDTKVLFNLILAYVWELAARASRYCTSLCKPPNSMALEKMMWIYELFSRKRYMYVKYEEQCYYGKGKLVGSGIATVRRDSAPITKEIMENVQKILFGSVPIVDTPYNMERKDRIIHLMKGFVLVSYRIMKEKITGFDFDGFKTRMVSSIQPMIISNDNIQIPQIIDLVDNVMISVKKHISIEENLNMEIFLNRNITNASIFLKPSLTQQCVDFIIDQCKKILTHDNSMKLEKFIMSRLKAATYKNDELPHLHVNRMNLLRDNTNDFAIGDRCNFVYRQISESYEKYLMDLQIKRIKSKINDAVNKNVSSEVLSKLRKKLDSYKELKNWQRAEDVKYMKQNNVLYDEIYYIRKLIQKPVVELMTWFMFKDRIILEEDEDYEETIKLQKEARKRKMGQFFTYNPLKKTRYSVDEARNRTQAILFDQPMAQYKNMRGIKRPLDEDNVQKKQAISAESGNILDAIDDLIKNGKEIKLEEAKNNENDLIGSSKTKGTLKYLFQNAAAKTIDEKNEELANSTIIIKETGMAPKKTVTKRKVEEKLSQNISTMFKKQTIETVNESKSETKKEESVVWEL